MPRRRLPRLRPHREARADRAAAGRRPGRAGEPVRRRRPLPPLRPRHRHRRGAPRRPGEVPRSRRGCTARPPAEAGVAGGETVRYPSRAEHERRVELAKEHIRRGRRVPDRALAARRAPDDGLAARRLPGAAADQPVAVSLPARARRHRARRLVARDARQGRRHAREPEPDRRHDERAARATPSGCSPPRRTAPST